MKTKSKILEEVEKTLNSFDHIPKLEENPFFFSRLKARIENNSITQVKEKAMGYVLKPVALVMILLINIITAVYFFKINTVAQNTQSSLVNVLSKDYQLDQTKLDNYNLE